MPSEGPGLTPAASSRPRRTRTYWTKDEDNILISAVETFAGSPSQWSEIAKCLNGRSPKDCRKRWANGLNTSLKKGPWTADEDAKLRQAVLLYKYDWASISKMVGHRSGDQCSKRWREVVDPSINKQPWTPEEDALLLRLFAKHGSAWQEIKEHFSNRRGLQCRNRCCHLLGTRSKKGRARRTREEPSPVTQDLGSFSLSNSAPSPQSSHSSSSSSSPSTPLQPLFSLPSPSVSPSHLPEAERFSIADNVGNMIVNFESTSVLSSSPRSGYVNLHGASDSWSPVQYNSGSLHQLPLNPYSQAASYNLAMSPDVAWDSYTTDAKFTHAAPSTRPHSTGTASGYHLPASEDTYFARTPNTSSQHQLPSIAPSSVVDHHGTDENHLLRFILCQADDPSFVLSCLRGGSNYTIHTDQASSSQLYGDCSLSSF